MKDVLKYSRIVILLNIYLTQQKNNCKTTYILNKIAVKNVWKHLFFTVYS